MIKAPVVKIIYARENKLACLSLPSIFSLVQYLYVLMGHDDVLHTGRLPPCLYAENTFWTNALAYSSCQEIGGKGKKHFIALTLMPRSK
jgi:hypothetical protein